MCMCFGNDFSRAGGVASPARNREHTPPACSGPAPTPRAVARHAPRSRSRPGIPRACAAEASPGFLFSPRSRRYRPIIGRLKVAGTGKRLRGAGAGHFPHARQGTGAPHTPAAANAAKRFGEIRRSGRRMNRIKSLLRLTNYVCIFSKNGYHVILVPVYAQREHRGIPFSY